MSRRTRSFVGMLALVGFVVFYMLAAMVLSTELAAGKSGFTQFLVYVFFGLVWIVPAGLIVRWMARE